jgi:hypothetical protein
MSMTTSLSLSKPVRGPESDPLIRFPVPSSQEQGYLGHVFALIRDLKVKVSLTINKLKALAPKLDLWKPIIYRTMDRLFCHPKGRQQ